jgi:hypothetical protein
MLCRVGAAEPAIAADGRAWETPSMPDPNRYLATTRDS